MRPRLMRKREHGLRINVPCWQARASPLTAKHSVALMMPVSAHRICLAPSCMRKPSSSPNSRLRKKPTRFPNFPNYWPLCRWQVHSSQQTLCILRPSRPATLSSRRRRITCSSSKKTNPPCIKISPILNWSLFPPQHTTIDKAHGRLEVRHIWTSAELNGYVDFPHAKQVCAIRRKTTHLVSDKCSTETVYAITSLESARAAPSRLLDSSRKHWCIENRLHYVRDVTFDEDRSRVRRGAGAHPGHGFYTQSRPIHSPHCR